MRFDIKITSGKEVRRARFSENGLIYFGEAPGETGAWQIDMNRLEEYLDTALRDVNCGDSIETFVLGFEIADLAKWGDFFTSMSEYASYRPKMKMVISVAQFNWPDVKDLAPREQFKRLQESLQEAILRIATMKRKPKNFDVHAFAAAVTQALDQFPSQQILVDSQ